LGGLLLLLEVIFALLREEIGQFLGAHLEQLKPGDFLLNGGVVDGFGMQLLLDIIVEAHLLHHFHITGPRAEGDAIEDVDDLVAVRRRRCGCSCG